MAALKRNGEEDWKKKNQTSILLNEDDPNKVSIVKLQKEQLKQQLQMTTPKLYQSKINTSDRRNILAPLNDNNLLVEDDLSNINKLSASNESLENIEQNQRPKLMPGAKRVIFGPNDFNSSSTLLRNF